MPTIPAATLLAQLGWRYATKRFDPARKLAPQLWDQLAEALRLSPSSYGLQPWKFIVVTDPGLKQRLRPASRNQAQIIDCSHLVVFAAKRAITATDADRLIAATASARGVAPDDLAGIRQPIIGDLVEGPRSRMSFEWSARQCYLALGNLLTSAAALGVDACPMEGFDPQQYDRILGLEGGEYGAVVVAALGYRAAADKYAQAAKVRYPGSEVFDLR